MTQLPYRKNVCLLITNAKKELLLGERYGEENHWQFPQGGIEEGTLIENAIREASEELNCSENLFEAINILDTTYSYKWVKVPEFAAGKFQGQEQSFVLLKFLGEDLDINPTSAEHIEFSKVKWVKIEEIKNYLHPLRQEGFEKIIPELSSYLK